MHKMKTLGVATGVLAICLANPSWAQDENPIPAAAAEAVPNDIIVTARRVEERLQDVPISISVFSQKDISERNIVTAADLGTYTPSLTANSRFGPDKASFAIRGFQQDNGTAPSVGVYFAEVPAAQSAGATTGGNGAGPGAFFDLQNVQVLKGPQGTLFGRNTTGGAVLLTPQKPTKDFGGYVEGSLGDFGLRRVQAVVNAPLADSFSLRLGVDRHVRDGYLRNHSGVGPDRLGSVDYWAFRGSIVGDLTPNLENYTIVSYSKSDAVPIVPRIIACRNVANITGVNCPLQLARQAGRGDTLWDVENNHPDPVNKISQLQIVNTTKWQVSDTVTIKNIVSYSEYRETTRFNINGDFFWNTYGAPFVQIYSSHAPGQNIASQRGFTEELQLQGRTSDDRFVYTAGFYMENSDPLSRSAALNPANLICTDYLALQCRTAAGVTGSASDTNWTIASRSRALFGQGTIKLTDRLAVTGGVRYTWDKTMSSSDSLRIFFDAAGNPTYRCHNSVRHPSGTTGLGRIVAGRSNRAECRVNLETSSDKPTWMIDLEYKPVDDMMIYAKWSRGYRQGYINVNTVALETFDPEKVDTYEIGAKTSFTMGPARGYINFSAFYNDFTNQQIATSATARPGSGAVGAQVIVNAGTSVIKGFEVDASVTMFDVLKLDVGYAYLDSKLKSLVFPALDPNGPYEGYVPLPTGGPLALTPKHRLSLTGTVTLPFDESVGKVEVGATFVYTSEQFSNPNPFGILPPSHLLNLNANWNSIGGMPIDASVFVTNVTNKEYINNVTNGWIGFGLESAVPGLPRMFGARLRYRFGN